MSLYKFLATPKSQNLAVQEWESIYQHTLPTHVGPNTRYNQRIHPSLNFCIGKFWGDSNNASMSLRFLSRFGRQCLAVSRVKRLPLRVFSWEEMWAQTISMYYITFNCFFWSAPIRIRLRAEITTASRWEFARWNSKMSCGGVWEPAAWSKLPYRWGPTKPTWWGAGNTMEIHGIHV